MSNILQSASRLVRLLLLLLVVIAAIAVWRNLDTLRQGFRARFVPHQTVWASTPVVESIRQMSRLVTASYYEEDIEVRSRTRIMPLAPEELVMIYKVTIEAGFDLSRLPDDAIRLHGDTAIILQLPAPTILTRRCNPSDQIVFHDSNSWSEADLARMYQKAIDEVEHNAKREGLIAQAIINGRHQLTLLLCSFGFDEEHVHVYVRE